MTEILFLGVVWAGALIWFRKKGKLNPPWYADWTTSGAVLGNAIVATAVVSDRLYYGISYLANPDLHALRHLGIVDR